VDALVSFSLARSLSLRLALLVSFLFSHSFRDSLGRRLEPCLRGGDPCGSIQGGWGVDAIDSFSLARSVLFALTRCSLFLSFFP